ncbi:hypothetical protein DFP73DRAFT_531683 [Morchella snyderi]|nr:hypothetical protein DFP73DRAFT_531683 [Morchella snyderi]
MCNTWKRRSRENQQAARRMIKDNHREKIREKKCVTIEGIPEDGFGEDDEALAADIGAFRNARKAPPSARGGPSVPTTVVARTRLFMVNFGALKRKRKAAWKRMKRSKNRGIVKKARMGMCGASTSVSRALTSALGSIVKHFGEHC